MMRGQAGEHMRSTIGQAGIIGLGVAVAALVIRSVLGAEPLHIQLLAVLGAGALLALAQLLLGRSLGRPPRRLAATRAPISAPPPPVRPRAPEPMADRDSGWTGLATPPSHPTAPAPPDAQPAQEAGAPHEP